MAAARRPRLSSTACRSAFHLGYDSSPGTGGCSMTPMATCPGTLGLRLIEDSLYISATTFSGTFSTSIMPPRSPHSPNAPFDVVWKVRTCVSLSSAPPAFASTPRALMKGLAEGSWVWYTLSWYTSSHSSASSSLWQILIMPSSCDSVSCCPVGLPGLMNTSPRGHTKSARALSTAFWMSSRLSPHSASSSSSYGIRVPPSSAMLAL
mmetsp:Transcript_8552/g.17384  ORF Transcript_8552/g.17384 Transcript_8552/m.17384 type:complete len:207 (-) Transcript_8552:755-1375(-)